MSTSPRLRSLTGPALILIVAATFGCRNTGSSSCCPPDRCQECSASAPASAAPGAHKSAPASGKVYNILPHVPAERPEPGVAQKESPGPRRLLPPAGSPAARPSEAVVARPTEPKPIQNGRKVVTDGPKPIKDELKIPIEQPKFAKVEPQPAKVEPQLRNVEPKPMTDAGASTFNHAPDYSFLIGELTYSQVRKQWRVRYAPLHAEDRYGGSVTLDVDRELKGFRSGQLVEVKGGLVDRTSRDVGPLYRVTEITALK